MKLRLFAAILLLVSAAFGAQPTSAIDKAHAAALHTLQRTIVEEESICSATAIAKHAILTATHCELPTDDISVASATGEVHILGRIRDSYDHTIYLVDATFSDYVNVKVADPLDQAEEVFLFGNPGIYVDLYRKGYVAGYRQWPGKADSVMLDFQGFFGDSGAGIFNKDGDLVAVFSFINAVGGGKDEVAIQFVGVYRLQFTEADLEQARKFVPPAAK